HAHAHRLGTLTGKQPRHFAHANLQKHKKLTTKTPRHQEQIKISLLLFLVPWCLGGKSFSSPV
ncbi:MAG TPA: hypothetical protein VJ463_00030, partial [Geothrix sp.]|nr:hypothetical protein [Geothrix sp.]